jgi:hypothetical protein
MGSSYCGVRHMAKRLAVVSLLLLAGCAEAPPPMVKVVRLTLPAELLACEPAAEIPTTDDKRVLFDWGAAERTAGEDCRDKLGRIRDLQAQEADPPKT